MSRLAVLLALVLAGAGVLLAPRLEATTPPPVFRTVDSSLLVCPALAVTDDSASQLSALVAQAPDDPTQVAIGAAGQGPGASALRPIDAEIDLARVVSAGDPVSLLVAGRSQPPITMTSTGAFAPSALAGIASYEASGTGRGLASAACLPPGSDWWFVAAGSELGRGAALLVSNPAQEPARFDIDLFARSGPVTALAGRGVSLGPQSRVRLRLDALAPDEELLAIRVRATSGRIAAALRDVSVPSDDAARGVDFIPPAAAPATRLHLVGIPGGEGSRDLVLVNPGAQFATLQVRLLTEAGMADLPGLATLTVPAGSVITTSLDRFLGGRAVTLELTSDVPVTGGVRSEWGRARRDMSWLSAAEAVAAPNTLAAAALAPAGPGLATSVTVVAPDGPVRGVLQVITTGSASQSLREQVRTADARPARPEGPTVLTGAVAARPPLVVDVPAGSARTIAVDGLQDRAIAHLVWSSEPSSGPALLSHLTVDPDRPAATGYSWWPTASAVRITPAREDLGTLLPDR